MALDFAVEGQRRNGRLRRILMKNVEEQCLKVCMGREDEHFPSSPSRINCGHS